MPGRDLPKFGKPGLQPLQPRGQIRVLRSGGGRRLCGKPGRPRCLVVGCYARRGARRRQFRGQFRRQCGEPWPWVDLGDRGEQRPHRAEHFRLVLQAGAQHGVVQQHQLFGAGRLLVHDSVAVGAGGIADAVMVVRQRHVDMADIADQQQAQQEFPVAEEAQAGLEATGRGEGGAAEHQADRRQLGIDQGTTEIDGAAAVRPRAAPTLMHAAVADLLLDQGAVGGDADMAGVGGVVEIGGDSREEAGFPAVVVVMDRDDVLGHAVEPRLASRPDAVRRGVAVDDVEPPRQGLGIGGEEGFDPGFLPAVIHQIEAPVAVGLRADAGQRARQQQRSLPRAQENGDAVRRLVGRRDGG